MESLLDTTPRNSSSSLTSHASEFGDRKEGRMRRACFCLVGGGVSWGLFVHSKATMRVAEEIRVEGE